ncbi:MAG: hypothetical protein CK424_01275 [Legionella sp.]|nr:MAG: hypothetical protein CK424_01275 [Legionella sp.]
MNNKHDFTISNSSWSRFWKHRNFNLIDNAPADLFVASASTNTMSDWNRLINSKEKCSYYINGEQLSKLRHNKPFETADEFQTFLKEQLFKDQSPEKQEQLVAMVLAFGYQSGLFHATSSAITKMVGDKNATSTYKIALSQPDMQIHLITDNGGLRVIEQNEYRTWTDLSGKGKHTCTDKEYYAKTQTIYAMTPEHIEMRDLLVDCPSRHLAHIFDERPGQEQMMRFPVLRELIATIIAVLLNRAGFGEENAAAPEAKSLHRPQFGG